MTTLQSPPTFSGHETFALRGGWLKKAFDLLTDYPDLFGREDAFVLLSVGKNMATSIRFWGRVCEVFTRDDAGAYKPTPLGNNLLADDGWDPYLVTPAARWLLHWHVAARRAAAFTWFYTFNLLRGGECSPLQLASQIQAYVEDHGGKAPSDATIKRDVECLFHTYTPPDARQLAAGVEDALACPLSSLGLLRKNPGQRSAEIEQTLLSAGVPEEAAKELAASTVSDGLKYVFAESDMETYAFFTVRQSGGALVITLNTGHPAFSHLVDVVSREENGNDAAKLQARLTRAADGLKLLLSAWARYEDEQTDNRKRDQVKDARADWGRMARRFLEREE